jgi:hypothetical protein
MYVNMVIHSSAITLREKNVGLSLFHVALVHRRPACRRQFLDLAESHRAAPHYYGPGDL